MRTGRTEGECIERLREINDRMGVIAKYEQPTHAQAGEFRALMLEFEDTDTERLMLVEAAQRTKLLGRLNKGELVLQRGAGGEDDDDTRGGAAPGVARQTIDQLARSGALTDDAAQLATRTVESGSAHDRNRAAEWVRVAGDPAYARAFAAIVADPVRGHLSWTEHETAAYRAVTQYRAMSESTDGAGGFLVPLIVDPAVTLTSALSVSAMRAISRTVTVTTNAWRGVSSAGVSAEWHPEAAEVSEATPTLTDPTVPIHTADAYVKFSVELGADASGLLADLGRMLADAADRLQAQAFVSGTGVGMPEGVVTGLTGTASERTPITPETLVAADLFAMQNSLPSRWQPGASWVASMQMMNQLAQLPSGGTTEKINDRIAVDVGNGRLLRRPLAEVSDLPGAVDTGVTAPGRGALIYGDFGAGYLIATRAGTTVELQATVTGPNGRPTLQRGLLMWLRTGAGVIIPEALRMLTVATTAP